MRCVRAAKLHNGVEVVMFRSMPRFSMKRVIVGGHVRIPSVQIDDRMRGRRHYIGLGRAGDKEMHCITFLGHNGHEKAS